MEWRKKEKRKKKHAYISKSKMKHNVPAKLGQIHGRNITEKEKQIQKRTESEK